MRLRQGSYEDPAALRHSLLVSSNDPPAAAVAASRRLSQVGAGPILYTSHQSVGAFSPSHPAREHAATEQLPDDSGVAWTALRNGFYAHSLAWLLGPWRQTGTITTPVSWADREAAAEAAAVVLAGERTLEGMVTLPAREAVAFDDVAAMATAVSGREVTRVALDRETWIADKVIAGAPEAMARMTLTIFQAARQGRVR